MNSAVALDHLQQDALLRCVIEQTVLPAFVPSRRIYYDLLDSIVSQQLSVKVASVIFSRFCTLFPDNYPHPELVIALEPEQLRSVGLSGQKAGYLQNVAAFFLKNDLENHPWATRSDAEIIDFLSQIKGVGKWTAQMLLMFTLERPDIFPIDDLGIQQAMIRLYGLRERGKALKKRMVALAEPWQPHRTLASRYLWRWKDTK
ncbi:MAG: DNA-3-methyladenine glycosylase 2 family protein [Saprospiraceae bacterium]|nr:DNA-3-methyladenine glycosylase 2 family protein [Saprospiraceae bacterium]